MNLPKMKKLHLLAALFGVLIAVTALALYGIEISRLPSLAYFNHDAIGGDFIAFWSAARLALFGDAEGAYRYDAITAMMSTVREQKAGFIQPLYYPPTLLLLIWPYGFFEYVPGLFAFFFSTLALFLWTVWKITRKLWFVLFMLSFTGIWLNLVTGQNGMLTASLFGLSMVALRSNATLSGIVLGLLSFKPHLGLVAPFALLSGRHYRCFFFAALVTVGFAALALIIFGPETWLLSLIGTSQASITLSIRPQLMLRIPSVFSLFRLTGLVHGQAMIVHLLLTLPLVVWTMYYWRRCENGDLKAAMLATVTLLFTPFVYDYDMMLIAIALAFMANSLSRSGWWWAERALFALMMIWPVMVNKISQFIGLQLGVLGPLLLLLFLFHRASLEIRGQKQP